ncbi:MAG: GNAT family N-acetyltransferase [Planctomycetota bacterium]
MQGHRFTNAIVRLAREPDIPRIIRICRESIVETYGSFIDAEKIEPWTRGDEVRKFVSGNREKMLVSEVDGEVLGVVSIDGDMIDLLWVKLEVRGRGLGTGLMEETERRIFSGFGVARVECFEPNTASIEFYGARGFSAVETVFDSESGVNKVLMEKTKTEC